MPEFAEVFASRLICASAQVGTADMHGRVTSAIGTLVRATGVSARVGELCLLSTLGGEFQVQAEVVGFDGDELLLTPLGEIHGLSPDLAVTALGHSQRVRVGDAMLGRVFDGLGNALGTTQPIELPALRSVHARPPPALERSVIERPLPVGVRAIDGFATCGEGQRLGIFAPAGCGKSTLLGMIARNAVSDVNVIALIGERGREVNEFIADCLGPEGLARSVLVVATSDRPALERVKAAQVATTIAEYFRDQGRSVLLLLDSVTRYARALREIGLACGEPPTRRAYPPSVFSALPRLFERAGRGRRGAITGFYTVLEETDDGNDPVSEEVRSLLDGHLVLSRELAGLGQYPAIDVLNSVSRLMPRLADARHQAAAVQARARLARYRELEMLIRMGEYKPGHDAEADTAVRARPALLDFLKQAPRERVPFDAALAQLQKAVA